MQSVSSSPVDLNHAAADAAIALLYRVVPEDVPILVPYLYKLFSALAEGHAFIWLSQTESEVLTQQAQNTVGKAGDNTPLVLADRRLFLGRVWQLEQDLATEFIRLAEAQTEIADCQQVKHQLAAWFVHKNSQNQRDAVALALLKPFILISGGPGTGKTTTVAKLLGLLCSNEQELPRIALTAPTGKAADRMTSALQNALNGFDLPDSVRSYLQQLKGLTVHRLLNLHPFKGQPDFNRENPLPLDILIVDEASMLDTALLLQLLRAIPKSCRVILLGDEHQLPSVGGVGTVLSELAQPTQLSTQTARKLAKILPQHGLAVAENPPPLAENTARLYFSHRFGADSGIGCLARAIIHDNAEAAWAQFAKFPHELNVQAGSIKQQAEILYLRQTAYWQAVTAGNVEQAFSYQTNAVMLAALRDDTAAFNEAYRFCLQRHGLAGGDAPWFCGQMIMVSRNDYGLGLYNGDTGLILPDGENPEMLAAYFSTVNGYRKIALSRLPEHETAFAVTVHKSQGSEYDTVYLLAPSVQYAESQRNFSKFLLYTAVTRARKQFVFCGTQAAFQTACNTDEHRRSALRQMINDIKNKKTAT